MKHDLNILMIFGIKEKSIILTHIATNIVYPATEDCFCAPGSQFSLNELLFDVFILVYLKYVCIVFIILLFHY